MESNLSSEEEAVVAVYPFSDTLDALRERLDAFALDMSPRVDDDIETLLVIWRMLVTLMAHEAAFHLKIRGSTENVSAGLGRLFASTKLVANLSPSERRQYGPLARAIVDRRPDIDVWAAALSLLRSQPRPTSGQIESSSSSSTATVVATSAAPSSRSQHEGVTQATRVKAITNKVFIADAVQSNEFFFPYDAMAKPRQSHRKREEFVQAVLRDLDRLYIKIVDEQQDFGAYKRLTKNVRALGPRFPLWQFELVIFHVVKRLDIDLADFEVFRGLQA